MSDLACSFCSKDSKEVKKLIAGPGVHICDDCVNLCYGILNEKPKPTPGDKLPSPREIKGFLDEYVIGQDDAKETFAIAIYNHYKRLANPVIDDVEIEKGNLILAGPSGSGKSLMVETAARILNVPFAVTDATTLTETGYVGADVDTAVARLLQAAEGDVEKTQKGIIFIDEIDKLKCASTSSGTKDVSGEGVQQGLLKMLEGCDVMVSSNGKKGSGNQVKINTKNILFVVGGAFVGLDKIVERDINKDISVGIGFGANINKPEAPKDVMRHLAPEHFVKFGLIQEMVGRLPIIATLGELTEDQLVGVLTKPKNAVIKQFTKMFQLDDIELVFEEDALRAIAKKAKECKTGARGLRGVIESVLRKTQYELPELSEKGVEKIIVHLETVVNNETPTMIYGKHGDRLS